MLAILLNFQKAFNTCSSTLATCYRTNSIILANYSLPGQILERVKEHSYLDIILDQMTFTSHSYKLAILHL